MNGYIKTAFSYAILGLVGGVFYRGFTKFNGVAGGTSLAYIHVHTLMLGIMFFLLLALRFFIKGCKAFFIDTKD